MGRISELQRLQFLLSKGNTRIENQPIRSLSLSLFLSLPLILKDFIHSLGLPWAGVKFSIHPSCIFHPDMSIRSLAFPFGNMFQYRDTTCHLEDKGTPTHNRPECQRSQAHRSIQSVVHLTRGLVDILGDVFHSRWRPVPRLSTSLSSRSRQSRVDHWGRCAYSHPLKASRYEFRHLLWPQYRMDWIGPWWRAKFRR